VPKVNDSQLQILVNRVPVGFRPQFELITHIVIWLEERPPSWLHKGLLLL
jgi:hypothetical protein